MVLCFLRNLRDRGRLPVDITFMDVVDTFVDPIVEPIRIAGDLVRAAQAGIASLFTGETHEPEWHSNHAKENQQIPPGDAEANLK